MADDFITIDQLADYMDADELFTTSAELAIASAQESVRQYTGQTITVEDIVERRDGTGAVRMRLWQRPVRELTTVAVDDVELDPTAYWLDRGVVKLLDSWFTRGHGNVTFTYTAGWDLEDSSDATLLIPADITLVTLSVAARRYRGMSAADPTMRSETIGQYSYQRADDSVTAKDVLPAEAAVLDRYTVRLVA